MADFLPAYERVIVLEGGYTLHNVKDDRGGQTYAGIARKHWPAWPGWQHIDRGEVPPTPLVRDFYRRYFWDAVKGDEIADQDVATSIYSCAVNMGVQVAARLAQVVVGTTPDGDFGPRTLSALNAFNPALFLARFSIAKMARYVEIVRRERSQAKFLLGWMSRVLKESP
jgi:lysozyme family protein